MVYDTFTSPIGTITIASNGTAVTELHIQDDKYFLAPPKDWKRTADDPLLIQARNELLEFFDKRRTTFTIPLMPKGTPFQQTVWNALKQIPPGQTVSYMQIAEAIGKPKTIRAVGSAIGRNPLCILIPCHRVMGSDGKFHGYVAGVKRKQFLLELEGMTFIGDSYPMLS